MWTKKVKVIGICIEFSVTLLSKNSAQIEARIPVKYRLDFPYLTLLDSPLNAEWGEELVTCRTKSITVIGNGAEELWSIIESCIRNDIEGMEKDYERNKSEELKEIHRELNRLLKKEGWKYVGKKV